MTALESALLRYSEANRARNNPNFWGTSRETRDAVLRELDEAIVELQEAYKQQKEETMLDLIKQCKNKKCERFNRMFQPSEQQKYCLVCGSRLKRWADPTPSLAGFVHGGPPVAPRGDESFVGASDCDVKGCPVAPDGGRVEIPWRLYNQWVYLAQQNDVEWIAYLKGSVEEGVYKLAADGMYFPEQEATGAHVDAADNSVEEPETIAAVHSHVDMAAFFSTEDEKHFNHPVELVVNRKGHCEAVVRVKLECGRYQRAKAKVLLIEAEDAVNAQAALAKVLTVQQTTVVSYGGGGGRHALSKEEEEKTRWGSTGYGTILDT